MPAVVYVSGPADLTQQHDAEGDAFLSSFLGAEYSKRPEVWRDASPLSHVSKINAPFLIVHGTRDSNVPIAQSEALADRLRQAGVPVTLVKVDDGHTFQTPEARRRLAYETLGFFNRYLKNREVTRVPRSERAYAAVKLVWERTGRNSAVAPVSSPAISAPGTAPLQNRASL